MTKTEVYLGHPITAAEQPAGGWAAEIVELGGGGRVFQTQMHREQAAAMAAARRMLVTIG